MTLKLIAVSVLTLFLLNSCTPKVEYIQPKLPELSTYIVSSLEDVTYNAVKGNNSVEYVISPEEFDRMINWINRSKYANTILNDQIIKYNKYAKGIDDGSK